MNQIIATFIYSYRSVIRNWKSNIIMLVLPIVFMGIFGIAFGGEQDVSFEMGLYQPDTTEFSLEEIFNSASDDSDSLDIIVTAYDDLDVLNKSIKDGQITIGLALEESLSQGGEFEILLDQNDAGSQIRRSIITDVLEASFFGGKPITMEIVNPDKQDLTGFDFLAPGLIVYGLIILIPGVAQRFTELSEKKYVFRYSYSKIKSYHIILGNVLFYFAFGIVQAIILYYTATLFGYQAIGNLWIALVPVFTTLFFVIAAGLLIGSFYKQAEGATNLGTIISIILGFFSGAFISDIGNVLEFDAFGQKWQFNDLFPTKWGTEAVEKILTNNLSLVDITTELAITLISGIILLGLGIVTYSQRQLKFDE